MERLTKYVTPVGYCMTTLNSMKQCYRVNPEYIIDNYRGLLEKTFVSSVTVDCKMPVAE